MKKKKFMRTLSISMVVAMFLSLTSSVFALEESTELSNEPIQTQSEEQENSQTEQQQEEQQIVEPKVKATQTPQTLNATSTSISASDVTVSNNGYDSIMGDSVAKIYYQEGTGLNTLAFTEFTVNDGYDDYTATWSESENAFTWFNYTIDKNGIEVKITDNPVASKSAGDTFDITCSVTYTDYDGNSSSTTITVPAEIVKVEGTITDEVDVMEEYYFSHEEDPQVMHDLWDELYNKYVNSQLTYSVKLNNGSTTTAKGSFVIDNTAKGGGTGIQPGIVRGYYLYNLKYKADTTGTIPALWRGGKISIVDADNNVYAFENDSQTVSFIKEADRNDSTFKSDLDVKISGKYGNLPAGAVLKGKQITDLNLAQPYLAYDLNVYDGNTKIQPVGVINLTFSVTDELKGQTLAVYYVNTNGKYIEVPSKVTGDTIVAETDHFSTYVVTAKMDTANPPINDNGGTNDGTGKTQDNKADEKAPDTGDNSKMGIFAVLCVMAALGALMTFKRRANQ